MQKIIILIMSLSLFGVACQFSALSAAQLAKLPTIPIPSPSSTPGVTVCTVTADKSLNVRAAAGIDSPVIAWLSAGDVVTILSDPPAGEWLHIQTQSGLGWINSKFCEVNND